MLSKPLAFEQDKIAIFLRNQEMHLHFSKLESIKNRKNIYLPQITTNRRQLKKNGSSLHLFKDKDYFIRRDNNLIFYKLSKIFKRPNQISNDSEIIDGYLNVKKCSREKYLGLKKELLTKENIQIKNRISNAKPVIDNKQLNQEFEKSKKISGQLRKIQPSDSASNIYLNKKESNIIRLYEKEKMDYYLKEREKEKKEKEKEELNGIKDIKNVSSSVDNTRLHSKTINKKYEPFKIDKKILGKIKYV